MQSPIEQFLPNDPDWQQLCKMLRATVSLTTLVLTAWHMGLWLARKIVEQQLTERARYSTQWSCCPMCGTRLVSKGLIKRQMLTLVGRVEWKRRVGRCPRHCPESHKTPFDETLGIQPYQQTSTELMRLGCLLAVFLPFEVASWMLYQISGIQVSDDTIWQWVQNVGQTAIKQLKLRVHL